jgi:Amt family ammonium transporter
MFDMALPLAAEATLNTGNNGFMMVCAALVFIMTPGLAFFYGGLGRRKNVISNMMNSVFIMGACSLLWLGFGFSLAFSGDTALIVGDFKEALLMGSDPSSIWGGYGISTYTFFIFQMMFALITPALITGAIAGRMKFKALFIFILLWSVVVYYPLAHMVWGGGLLGTGWLDSVDFAGGNVVHISSGISGLVLCLLLGRRHGYQKTTYRIHNVPFIVLGMGLLWFGWFGFNAGSALEANGLAVHAFVTTVISPAAAMVSWMLIDVIKQGKPTLVGACTGVVVGLVAITPGAGFVPVWAALIIGFLVSPVCYFGVHLLKVKLGVDDALDAFGCHGIGGIYGGLMTGLFADPAVNGYAGLFFGDAAQFGKQALSIVITIAVAILGTLICAGITRIFTPLRVEKRDELIGLDVSQHGEVAYPSFTGLD